MTGSIDTAGNITSLKRRRQEKKPLTRASALLEQCREQLHQHMKSALPGIMDQVDDALFDLSNKADSNQLQSTYFEAMRSVRLCRDAIESQFVNELNAAMLRKCVTGRLPGGLDSSNRGPITLSLVEQDDIEESVAVKNIAGKISNLCAEDLFALDRRIALLLDSPPLKGEDNPLGPHVLCSAARSAVDVIEANVEIRLLVLKLFDRHLTRAAQQFYPQINAWLVKEGVLPSVNITTPVRSRNSRAHVARAASEVGRAHVPASNERNGGRAQGGGGYGTDAGWQSYHGDGNVGRADDLAGRDPDGANHPDGSSSSHNPSAGALHVEQVRNVLDQIMRIGGAMDDSQDAPQRERFIDNLTTMQRNVCANSDRDHDGNLLRELKVKGVASAVSHTDGLMIDVVAMMFDFILEDENIGDAMRALLARLQIAVLKVAILDKSFFARRNHPARSFINSLAELGGRIDSDDPEHQPTLKRVQDLVKRILDDFDDRIDVFSGALEELDAIVAQDEDCAKRNAWTTTKVAEERDKLARARRTAEEQVDGRLAQAHTQEVVACFLRDHWRHLLSERLFRDGNDGESWHAGVQTMEHLLWSVMPKNRSAERDRLLEMLPRLLDSLKTGMDEMGLASESRTHFMQAFSKLHIHALRGEQPPKSAPVVKPAAEEITEQDAVDKPSDDPLSSTHQARVIQQAIIGDAEIAVHGAHASRTLQLAVERANEQVWATAEDRPQCQGMGTTVVALKLDGDHLVCAHAGDSRLYRMRDGTQTQLSDDHTYRREVVKKGLVSEADAANIANNMITRAVGGDATIQVEVNVHDIRTGDLFLCCSDGLSDMLEDAQINDIMRSNDDLQALADALITGANAAGGRDNISVGLLRIDAPPPPSTADESRDYAQFVSMVVATDPGRRRAHNEDSIECDCSVGAMVLADGMGGHNAGEVASAMTVKLVLETVREASVTPGEVPATPEASGADPEFDFGAISAVFWGEQVPEEDNDLLYEAVSAEVQDMVADAGDDLDVFDLELGDEPDPGVLADDLIQDAARDPLLDRILKLNCGVWVEFGEPGSKRVRARLSWLAPERSRYLFTDRLGQKVTEATPYGLAVELRGGRLRVLDGVPLFDRAVSSLTRRLRQAEASDTLH